MTTQEKVNILENKKQNLVEKYKIVNAHIKEGKTSINDGKPLQQQKQEISEEIKDISQMLVHLSYS